MYIVWYWWGFRLYVDDAVVHEFISAAEQGRSGIQSFLGRKAVQMGLWWLSPAASLVSGAITDVVNNVGVGALRSTDSGCGHRGCCFTIPWTVSNAYNSCR